MENTQYFEFVAVYSTRLKTRTITSTMLSVDENHYALYCYCLKNTDS